jgi:putative ABC transport system permease protein
MQDRVSKSVAEPRFRAYLLGIFAAVALLLAAVGIYGMMSYSVTERTREIGIRMALGANSRDMFKLVVGHGVALALAGIAIGGAGAFALTRFIRGFLYEVGESDPAVFSAIALLMISVAMIASFLPARRATRVDPMVALRHE